MANGEFPAAGAHAPAVAAFGSRNGRAFSQHANNFLILLTLADFSSIVRENELTPCNY
jgi:hypothetical protein